MWNVVEFPTQRKCHNETFNQKRQETLRFPNVHEFLELSRETCIRNRKKIASVDIKNCRRGMEGGTSKSWHNLMPKTELRTRVLA